MTGIKNWAIRPYVKDFRQPDDKYPKGVEARYVILDYLILCSNLRLRNFYGVETIMEECGFNSKAVVADALGWLFERGALYNVPVEYRIGKEATLSKNKYVFQLTGVIYLRDRWVPYLLLQDNELELMVEEWQTMGYQLPVEGGILLSGYKASQSEGEGITLSSDLVPPVLEGIHAAAGDIHSSYSEDEEIPFALRRSQKAANLTSDLNQSPIKTPRKEVGELLGHPMAVAIASLIGKPLTRQDYKVLQEVFTLAEPDDGSTRNCQSRLFMYDSVPGFSDFFLFRVNAYKGMISSGKTITVANFISDLRNENRPKSGWQAWKKNNPHLTTRKTGGSAETGDLIIDFDE